MWENIGLISLGIAVGLVIMRFIMNRTEVTLESATAALQEIEPLAAKIESAVQIVVNSIEQEQREPGSVQRTPEDKTDEVLNFVKEWVPRARHLPNKSIVKFIKSAVLIASTMTNQIAAAKATVSEVYGARK